MPLTIRSTAFGDHGAIPARHTCDGENVSPPLAWSGEPAGTRSFALIVDDPDAPDPAAPKMTYVHWVLWDLPAGVHELPAAAGAKSLPEGAHEGRNDAKSRGWTGPCPPIGRHRYFFKLHALDTVLGDLGTATKKELERAMEGHVLARAELVGTYEHGAGRR